MVRPADALHQALLAAIREGAVQRVRPKAMTVAVILAGLLPIMWGAGTGSEVMQRIAVPMIGGMVSSTVLTLLVIPVVYDLMDRRGDAYYRERGRKHAGEGLHGDEGGTAGVEEPA